MNNYIIVKKLLRPKPILESDVYCPKPYKDPIIKLSKVQSIQTNFRYLNTKTNILNSTSYVDQNVDVNIRYLSFYEGVWGYKIEKRITPEELLKSNIFLKKLC